MAYINNDTLVNRVKFVEKLAIILIMIIKIVKVMCDVLAVFYKNN